MKKTKSIGVFCSSSDMIEDIYKETARKTGSLLADKSMTLVYGAGNIGMMGIMSREMLRKNAKVIGVIPELLHSFNLAQESISELIVTKDMKLRKAKMHELSDAFIALPGGFGTLEELLEIITLKQLEYHNKAIVIVNVNGFYDKLQELFEQLFESQFAHNRYRSLYFFADSVEEAFDYIENYKGERLDNKWSFG